MDSEGNLWCVLWHGHAVIEIKPDGSVGRRVTMPVKTPACLCFGGAGLDRLYVTSAEGKPESEKLDGGLFEVTGGFKGKAASKFPHSSIGDAQRGGEGEIQAIRIDVACFVVV